MTATVMVLAGLAGLLLLIGNIVILVAAFRESVGWGLAVLLLGPAAALPFAIMHWEEAKAGFLCQAVGAAVLGLAVAATLALGLQSVSGLREMAQLKLAEQTGIVAVPGPGEDRRPEQPAVPTVGEGKELIGRPLAEVKDELGQPLGTLKTGGRTILCYPGMDIVSEDGRTVAEIVEQGPR